MATRAAITVLGGTITFGGAMFVAFNLSFKGGKQAKVSPTESERHSVFDKSAPRWDRMVRGQEFISGIGRLRRLLMKRAHGDVLEVAVGTGRNFTYYNHFKVKSVTAVDFSRQMLQMAVKKKSKLGEVPLRLKVANVSKLEFPDQSFDTVVDTFGICSFEAPERSLKEMARVCKDDGHVLLLEHGMSTWSYFRSYLNKNFNMHAHKYGCYCHRNIKTLVEESGMEIIEEKRKHFGTTYFLVCRPRKGLVPAEKEE